MNRNCYGPDPGLARNVSPPTPDDWLCDFCDEYHPNGEMPCAEEQQAFAQGPREYARWCLEELFSMADKEMKNRINVMIDRLEKCPEVKNAD